MPEDDSNGRSFVDALVDDPANPPQLQVLTGYRGRSAQEGHTRFYVDPELTAWVDVPDDAILFQREVQDDYGLGKSMVWARLDAEVLTGPRGDSGEDFLKGQVAQELGGLGGLGGGRNLVLKTPLLVCPTPPRLCPRSVVIQQCNPPSPLFVCPPISQQIPCPTRDPNACVLQTANPVQCPSLGITCTALPPCPLRTTPEQGCPPTPGIGCIPSVLIDCPPITQDLQQCGFQTANPAQCPSLGITCTALPPCPPRTVSPEQCPTRGITCTVVPGNPTQNLAGCIPRPTSSPQFCPVATPNPACIPNFPGDPGGPVEGGFGGQGFGNQAAGGQDFGGQAFEAQGMMGAEAMTQFCPVHQTAVCPIRRTALCPVPRTVQLACQRTVFQVQCHRTIFEPHCFQITPDWRIPITTPQFQVTPQLGGGFQQGAQGFDAQGGAGVDAVGAQPLPVTQLCPQPTQFCPPQTQLCPAPQTLQLTCPVTHNVQCFTSRMCPRSSFCPSVALPCQTGPVCQPVTLGCPFGGGGGGFGGGF